MKLINYTKNGSIYCGVLTDNGVVDIRSAWNGADAPGNVAEILAGGAGCLAKVKTAAESAEDFTAVDTVKILSPVLRPGKVIGLVCNYSKHAEEAAAKMGMTSLEKDRTVPRPFLMPSTVVIGHNEQIPWPVYSEQLDYEIELAVIIGAKAKNISPEEAAGVIAGYTICNDVSARSVTFSKGRTKCSWDEFYDWLNGKWADGFMPMGPYLLTADEVADAQNLDMRLTVNGRLRQEANTSEMIFSTAEIVSFLSRIMTLELADVIATGTPAGVGMATGRYLQAGDRIECTIEGLGTLRNSLGEKPEKFYEPLA